MTSINQFPIGVTVTTEQTVDFYADAVGWNADYSAGQQTLEVLGERGAIAYYAAGAWQNALFGDANNKPIDAGPYTRRPGVRRTYTN